MEATSKLTVWLGRTLSGLVTAFLALDAGMKLVLIAPVVEASGRLVLRTPRLRALLKTPAAA